jgi:CheY-like chemotaxis protein
LLVIDDIAQNRAMLSDLLGPLGFSIHEAASGEQGLQFAAALQPDAILVDRVMPVMDGIETTRRLRQAAYKGAIIAISASTTRADEERTRSAGANSFLAKPIRVHSLLALLEQHLGIRFIHERRPEQH